MYIAERRRHIKKNINTQKQKCYTINVFIVLVSSSFFFLFGSFVFCILCGVCTLTIVRISSMKAEADYTLPKESKSLLLVGSNVYLFLERA